MCVFFFKVPKDLWQYNISHIYVETKVNKIIEVGSNYFDDLVKSYGKQILTVTEDKLIKDIVANSTVDRGYGMHMPTEIKRYGEGLINTWLRKIYEGDVKVCHKIRCRPLLSELILYNPDGNFDRVMALMLAVYQKEEMRKYEVKIEEKVKTFLDHDFFNSGFQKKGDFAIRPPGFYL